MRRRRPNRQKDKKYFSRTADRSHPKNYAQSPMRGGWRI